MKSALNGHLWQHYITKWLSTIPRDLASYSILKINTPGMGLSVQREYKKDKFEKNDRRTAVTCYLTARKVYTQLKYQNLMESVASKPTYLW